MLNLPHNLSVVGFLWHQELAASRDQETQVLLFRSSTEKSAR